jgi:integrase
MDVSPAIIAAWLGHADASFTMRTYVHARPEDLAAARDALARKSTNE